VLRHLSFPFSPPPPCPSYLLLDYAARIQFLRPCFLACFPSLYFPSLYPPSLRASPSSSLPSLRPSLHTRYSYFWSPVDPEEVPDYYSVISHPMDLETMRCKVDAEEYETRDEFRRDVVLIRANARRYNPCGKGDGRGKVIVSAACNLLDHVDSMFHYFKMSLRYDIFKRLDRLKFGDGEGREGTGDPEGVRPGMAPGGAETREVGPTEGERKRSSRRLRGGEGGGEGGGEEEVFLELGASEKMVKVQGEKTPERLRRKVLEREGAGHGDEEEGGPGEGRAIEREEDGEGGMEQVGIGEGDSREAAEKKPRGGREEEDEAGQSAYSLHKRDPDEEEEGEGKGEKEEEVDEEEVNEEEEEGEGKGKGEELEAKPSMRHSTSSSSLALFLSEAEKEEGEEDGGAEEAGEEGSRTEASDGEVGAKRPEEAEPAKVVSPQVRILPLSAARLAALGQALREGTEGWDVERLTALRGALCREIQDFKSALAQMPAWAKAEESDGVVRLSTDVLLDRLEMHVGVSPVS